MIIEKNAAANGLTFGPSRILGDVSVWVACSPGTGAPDRERLDAAWSRILADGSLPALFGRCGMARVLVIPPATQ